MKKKILSLVLCLMMCLSVFAGCSLITRNDQKYFEAVVCSISYVDGTKDEITKRDLLMGFNSFGYNYVQNNGYTQQQAVDATLEALINQRLTIKAVELHYEELNESLEGDDPNFQPILNGSETTYLWDETYNAVYGNLKSYFMEILGISNGQDEEESANSSVYKPYTKNAELKEKNGKLVIMKTASAKTIRETYEERTNAENEVYDFEKKYFKDVMYTKLSNLTEGTDSSAKHWRSAFNKYLADIKKNYTYKKFANDKECFMFEMDRVYKILKDNYMTEKYEVIFNQEAHQDANMSNVTVSDVLKYYSSKVRVDYADFVINKNVSTYESNILSDVANVDYVLEAKDVEDSSKIGNYFYVGYVKMNLDENQKKQIAEIDQDPYLSAKEKEQRKQAIYSSVKATVRDSKTGETTDEKVDAQVLLNNIRNDVNSAGQYTGDAAADKMTGYEKAETFRKYLYLYNDDDSLKGAERNTVFGVKNNGDVLANSTFTGKKDVEEAIKQLYNEGNAKIGDTTDLVETEDGIYIFFYAGKVENLFVVDENFDASIKEDNIRALSSTRLNVFSEKTIFDSIFETLTKDNFAVFQNMNMQNLRSSLVEEGGIKAIKNNIKDMY